MARIRRFRLWAGALAALSVGACSPLDALDSLVPDDTYKRTTGIAYGEAARHKLDVYRPLSDQTGLPVVVFFYGGSWKSGDRAGYRFVGEAMASRGIVTVVSDYRLYPEVRFPDFLHDSAAVFAWVKKNIGSFGGDVDRIYLAGHSAGAYNAVMLSVVPDYLQEAGHTPSDVCGTISLAGPIALNLLDYNTTRPIFGHVADPDTTRPVMLVNGKTPPFLLVHGKSDGTVYPVNTEMFEAALQKAKTPYVASYPDGIGHYRIIAGIADPLEGMIGGQPLADKIASFVKQPNDCAKALPPASLSASERQ